MAIGNTATRIIVSIITIPLIIAVTVLGGIPFLIFVTALALISLYEISAMILKRDVNINPWIGYPSIIIFILNSYFSILEFEALLLLIGILILLVELFRNKKSAINNSGATLLGIFYTGLFLSALIKIREVFSYSENLYLQGGLIIVAILFSTWICDSAAFFLGTAFGKHKLFLRVSPNKSWEGAIFGGIFAVLTMLAAKVIILDFLSWLDVVIIGLIIGIVGQIGDLVESLMKRECNVKDSSALIPGHGGILDRFDSLLFTSPAVYLYLYYFVI